MARPLPSLRRPPIGFAHRGGMAHAPENTIEAFRLALRLGATGLESDAWVTADGVVVLHHDAGVGTFRKRPIGSLRRDQLPSHIPALADLYDTCGTGFELSLDLKDPTAAAAVIDVARRAGGEAEQRLWLCHGSWEELAGWRALSEGIKLVDSTRLKRIAEGPERRAATLRNRGLDAINLHHSDWNGGLAALFHRFDRYALGWDAQHDRVLDELLWAGLDGVFSDHVDRMASALDRWSRESPPG
jgi:glycerophosphoryl diester phosphodiesterase